MKISVPNMKVGVVSVLATPSYESPKQLAAYCKLRRMVPNNNICKIYFGRIPLHLSPSGEGVWSGGGKLYIYSTQRH
jgi:hypothetical protein